MTQGNQFSFSLLWRMKRFPKRGTGGHYYVEVLSLRAAVIESSVRRAIAGIEPFDRVPGGRHGVGPGSKFGKPKFLATLRAFLAPYARMITEQISEMAVKILDATGYAGAAGLMALESMIFPLPSEAVMPFVGFKVADGKWNLWLAIAATSLGSMIGSWLSYGIGYYGG